MKTILVDAWNTFVTEFGVSQEIYEMLEKFQNPKIILTNANAEEKVKYGIVDMPYEVFTLEHNPNKTDPAYYIQMLSYFGLGMGDVLYFEHNPDAVVSAQSVGIKTFHYNKDKKDINSLQKFLIDNL
ncbi:MAG: hypothetical protein HHAS10_01670 [Candidatus Altimarinota bacterium]